LTIDDLDSNIYDDDPSPDNEVDLGGDAWIWASAKARGDDEPAAYLIFLIMLSEGRLDLKGALQRP